MQVPVQYGASCIRMYSKVPNFLNSLKCWNQGKPTMLKVMYVLRTTMKYMYLMNVSIFDADTNLTPSSANYQAATSQPKQQLVKSWAGLWIRIRIYFLSCIRIRDTGGIFQIKTVKCNKIGRYLYLITESLFNF